LRIWYFIKAVVHPSDELALQLYITFFVCSCCVEKLAEQEKIAGELQRSLEQKDERINGMQRKIEVCNWNFIFESGKIDILKKNQRKLDIILGKIEEEVREF